MRKLLTLKELTERYSTVAEDVTVEVPEAWKAHAGCDQNGTLELTDRDLTVWTATCDSCGEQYGIPQVKVDPSIRARVLLQAANLPWHLRNEWKPNEGTADAVAACKQLITGWCDLEPPIVAPCLIGQPGTGKTHLLAMTVKRLIEQHQVPCWYGTLPDLSGQAQAEMGSGGSAQAVWDKAATVDLLVLDDLGAERPTEYRQDQLAALVDRRYRDQLPIMAATNLSVDRWTAQLGARTASRLMEMMMSITVTGTDRRML